MPEVRLHRCARGRWLRLGHRCACDQAEKLLAEHGIAYSKRHHSGGRSAHDMTLTNAAGLLPRIELARGYIVSGSDRVSGWILGRSAPDRDADQAGHERQPAPPLPEGDEYDARGATAHATPVTPRTPPS